MVCYCVQLCLFPILELAATSKGKQLKSRNSSHFSAGATDASACSPCDIKPSVASQETTPVKNEVPLWGIETPEREPSSVIKPYSYPGRKLQFSDFKPV